MTRQYNNELAPEVLAAMEQSPFTAERLAGTDDGGIHKATTTPNDFLVEEVI